MKRLPLRSLVVLACVVMIATACRGGSTGSSTGSVELAEFTESYVHVSIALEPGTDGQAVLAATFSPTEADAQLYSKDLPRDGVEGLGRPTRIELPAGSLLQAAGELQESLAAEAAAEESDLPGLLMYPVGAVTLRLPILLPGHSTVNDQVLISYMACTPRGCHAPVTGKVVEVKIPGR